MFAILFLMSFSAFAIHPQEGGGGNICYSSKLERDVVIDEFLYLWRHDIEVANRDNPGQKLALVKSESGHYYYTNLTTLSQGKEIEKLLMKHAEKYPQMGHLLLRIFYSLDKVYVSDGVHDRYVESDKKLIRYCEDETLRAAFLGIHELQFLSRTEWNRLNYNSQKILILHEIFRGLQLILGKEVIDNKNISLWTILLFLSDDGDLLSQNLNSTIRSFVQSYDSSEIEDLYKSQVVLLETYIANHDFYRASVAMKAVRRLDLLRDVGRDKRLYSNPSYNVLFEEFFKDELKERVIIRQ